MQSITNTQIADGSVLVNLKKIAEICAFLQLYAAVVCLAGSLLFSNSTALAICCGYLAICVSLTPVLFALYKKNFALVFSCISVFNMAPIWFLYLEAILPGYDAYEYIAPAFRMEALFWVAIYQLLVNLFYIFLWEKVSRFSINFFSFIRSIQLKPILFTRLSILGFIIPLVSFYLFYGSADILWRALTAGRTEGGSSGGLLIDEYTGGAASLMLLFSWMWQLTPLFAVIPLFQLL